MATIDRTEQMAKDIIQERYGQPLKAAMILCEELEAALRAAQKDAERYRWLRQDNGEHKPFVGRYGAGGFSRWTNEHADAAIDEAMGAVIDRDAPK